jgi:hypothetical protein
MFNELNGDSHSDPLYQMLLQEDKLEAQVYEAEHDSGLHQRNITAEMQSGELNFGDSGLNVEEDVQGTVSDDIILDLLAHFGRK